MTEANTGAAPADSPPTRRQVDGRIWLADLTHTGRGPASDTTPLGVGFLASYLSTVFDVADLRLFRYPEALARALSQVRDPPKLVGFASYVWNANLNLGFAREIKRAWPETVVVFGGPNFPLSSNGKMRYLAGYPQIDFFVDREGEIALAELIGGLVANDWHVSAMHGEAPSAYSLQSGSLAAGRPVPRLKDLDAIPSPYLSGSMDEFLDGYLVPTLQTNRGCPFTCSFCLEGDAYYRKVNFFATDRILAELGYIAERITDTIARGGRNELMITDSNFAMFAQDAAICEAIGALNERVGWPARVNVTTGKNRRDRVLSAIGRANGTIQLSGAVQSLDPQVLENVNRSNIKTQDLLAIARSAAESATTTYSDVILGLPGDGLESHVSTVGDLVDGGFGRVNTFQFALLMGAQLNTAEARELYGLRTGFRIVPRAFGRYEALGNSFVCGEIDEVCIGSNTLSFEDYVDARVYDLVVFLFHNDGVFSATEAALRACGARASDWLRRIWGAEWPGELADLRTDFVAATREQLKASPAEAEADLVVDIDRYMAGTSGNNVLYSFRGRALRERVALLVQVAGSAGDALVCDLGADARALVHQAVEFDDLALSGVLDEGRIDEQAEAYFEFDFERLLGGEQCSPSQLRDSGRTVRFMPSQATSEVLATYGRTMGNHADGLGRALSRVRVEDLRRVPVYR